MTEYYFPSLLYIKENLTQIFDSIYKNIYFDYDFIVYNEAERIMKSKDEITSRSLITLVQKSSVEYMREEYRFHKHDPSFIGIDKGANMLKQLFFNKLK